MNRTQKLPFRIDTPKLLHEIADSGLLPRSGVLKIPLNTLRIWLGLLSERAIKLNDPELNIIMLSMGLWDLTPHEAIKEIERQEKLIKNNDLQ